MGRSIPDTGSGIVKTQLFLHTTRSFNTVPTTGLPISYSMVAHSVHSGGAKESISRRVWGDATATTLRGPTCCHHA